MRPRPGASPAALAFLSADRRDIRPALVALYYADDRNGAMGVFLYGMGYLATWSERQGMVLGYERRKGVVLHALSRLMQPAHAGPADEWAREVGMRAQTFRRLSNLMLNTYKRRLAEGAERFIAAASETGGDKPGRPREVESLCLNETYAAA